MPTVVSMTRLAILTGTFVLAAPASASAGIGGHVSTCAREALGQRPAPPAVTCTHDGQTHTFATFGAMVRHHLAHDH